MKANGLSNKYSKQDLVLTEGFLVCPQETTKKAK